MSLICLLKTVGKSIIKGSDVGRLAVHARVAKPLIVAVWNLVSDVGESKLFG